MSIVFALEGIRLFPMQDGLLETCQRSRRALPREQVDLAGGPSFLLPVSDLAQKNAAHLPHRKLSNGIRLVYVDHDLVDSDGKSQTLPHRTRAFDLDDVEVRGFRGDTPAALHCELRIGVFRPVLFSKTLAQIDKRVGAANARRLRKKRNTAEEYRSTN